MFRLPSVQVKPAWLFQVFFRWFGFWISLLHYCSSWVRLPIWNDGAQNRISRIMSIRWIFMPSPALKCIHSSQSAKRKFLSPFYRWHSTVQRFVKLTQIISGEASSTVQVCWFHPDSCSECLSLGELISSRCSVFLPWSSVPTAHSRSVPFVIVLPVDICGVRI